MEKDLSYFIDRVIELDSFWYVGFRVLKPKKSDKLDVTILWNVLSNHLKFSDYFELDNLPEILYAFGCYLIQEKMISIQNLQEILKHECLERAG